jgi:stage IV sporulation protein FB
MLPGAGVIALAGFPSPLSGAEPVILTEPEATPYDLRWRMFGINVRVHPFFWLMALLLGSNRLQEPNPVQGLLIWVVCVFVSILVHEMGHVLMGRIFGARGDIVLYGFGGVAVGSSGLSNRWKRIAVYFAGPFAGFLLLALVLPFTLIAAFSELPSWVAEALWDLFVINLFWNLLNLLPIWPMDGGRISRDFLDWLMPVRGVRASLGISFTLAGLIAIHSAAAMAGHPLIPFFPFGGWWTAILFALLALGSYQELQLQSTFDSRPWEREHDSWR